MKKHYFILFLLVFLLVSFSYSQSVSETYNLGDIPTSHLSYDGTCNGPGTTLTIELPAGGPWEVTGFDVEYDMTAQNGAYMSEQRSLIHFQNTGAQEPVALEGVGFAAGTYSYNRSNLNFANGYYGGGDELIFEMRAWRSWSSFGEEVCTTHNNKVDDGTWKVTVHYQTAPSCIPPQSITISNIQMDEVDVAWTEIGSATQWNVEYGPQGFSQGNGTVVNVNNPTYTVSGLTDLTPYDIYLQSDCGGSDTSAWVGPITFTTAADCSAYTLEVTATTDDTIVCKGFANLSAQGSTTPNAEIYWFDAQTGGSVVGIGDNFTTSVITTTTSYWAAEVITSSGSGSGMPTYCAPGVFPSGCGVDNINDFVMIDAGIEHLGTGCSVDTYGDYTGDPNLTGVLTPGGNYDFSIVHGGAGLWVNIWVDLDGNGSFDDPGELLFSSTAGSNLTTGTISIPSSAQGGETAMRVMCRWNQLPTAGSCNTPPAGWGETHDYKVIVSEILCESTREEVVATVSQDGDEVVNSLPYVHTANTSTYGNTYTSAPGSGCGTADNYLNGNDVVYQFFPTSTMAVNIDISGLSDPYAAVFVYESCGDIGDTCIAGEINGPSTNDFGIADLEVTAGEDYYIVVSTWLSPDTDYTITISESLCPQPSDVTVSNVVLDGADFSWTPSLNDQNGYEWVVMQPGDHPLTDTPVDSGTVATGVTSVSVSGLNDDTSYVFFIRTDCDSDGLSGWVGPISFTTPILGATCEAAIEINSLPYLTSDNTSNYGSNYSGSPGSSCGTTSGYLNGDDVVYKLNPINDMVINIDLYNLTDNYTGIFVYESCADIGLDCSAGAFNQFSLDPLSINELFLEGGEEYYILISTWAFPQNVGYTLEITEITCPNATNLAVGYDGALGDVDFSWNPVAQAVDGYEWAMMTIGDHPDSSTPIASGSTGSGVNNVQIPTTTPDLYEYFVRANCGVSNGQSGWVATRFGSICESAIPVATLPFSHGSSTLEYGNDYSGSPGSSGCGSTSFYLDGYDVVYHLVPTEDMAVNIELSNLSDNYTGVFIYENCSDIGSNCIGGAVNGFATTPIAIEDFVVDEGQDYYIVISTWALPDFVNYTFTIEKACLVYPDMPVGDSIQSFCEGATVEDIGVTGTNIVWYDAPTGGNVVPLTQPLEDGDAFYAVQVEDMCESQNRLEVVVEITDRADMPQGANNQYFSEGYTLADLEVVGENLTWYVLEDGELVEIPNTTLVVDQQQYYVTQSFPDLCESLPLIIVPHVQLDTPEVMIEEIKYYPNPVSHTLTVSSQYIIDNITLFAVTGQKVLDIRVAADTSTLNVSELTSGIYLMKVKIDDVVGVFRIIKE